MSKSCTGYIKSGFSGYRDKLLQPASNVTVFANTEGWITFNMTHAAELWTKHTEANLGLFMKVLFITKGQSLSLVLSPL